MRAEAWTCVSSIGNWTEQAVLLIETFVTTEHIESWLHAACGNWAESSHQLPIVAHHILYLQVHIHQIVFILLLLLNILQSFLSISIPFKFI
jgi:uracil DNA glycosylase